MQKPKNKRKRAGQALVEFALTISVLFFFMAGIIDFGLAYFAYQGLKGAAHEAVSYGSIFPLDNAGNFNIQQIRDRLRYESGAPSENAGLRFVNLFDLDSRGGPDGNDVQTARILINFRPGSATGTSPLNCTTPQTLARQYCDIQVRVNYRYEPFFPLADFITDAGIELSATQQLTLP